jgi:hypothetical protein
VSHRDRDWWRDEAADRRAFSWSGTPVAWTIFGALLASWLVGDAALAHEGPGGAGARWLAWASLSARGVLEEGGAWRPLTWVWAHESGAPRAALWSLVLTFAFGRACERLLGGRWALATFAAGGLAAGLAALPWLAGVVPDRPIADASAGTFALAAAVARAAGDARGPADLPIRTLAAVAVLVRAADLLLLGGGPAYAPALLGAPVGWAVASLGLRPAPGPAAGPSRAPTGRPAGKASAPRRAPDASPEDAAARARLDALLEKIHAGGLEALDAEERAFLESASRRYRDPSSGPG